MKISKFAYKPLPLMLFSLLAVIRGHARKHIYASLTTKLQKRVKKSFTLEFSFKQHKRGAHPLIEAQAFICSTIAGTRFSLERGICKREVYISTFAALLCGVACLVHQDVGLWGQDTRCHSKHYPPVTKRGLYLKPGF